MDRDPFFFAAVNERANKKLSYLASRKNFPNATDDVVAGIYAVEFFNHLLEELVFYTELQENCFLEKLSDALYSRAFASRNTLPREVNSEPGSTAASMAAPSKVLLRQYGCHEALANFASLFMSVRGNILQTLAAEAANVVSEYKLSYTCLTIFEGVVLRYFAEQTEGTSNV